MLQPRSAVTTGVMFARCSPWGGGGGGAPLNFVVTVSPSNPPVTASASLACNRPCPFLSPCHTLLARGDKLSVTSNRRFDGLGRPGGIASDEILPAAAPSRGASLRRASLSCWVSQNAGLVTNAGKSGARAETCADPLWPWQAQWPAAGGGNCAVHQFKRVKYARHVSSEADAISLAKIS